MMNFAAELSARGYVDLGEIDAGAPTVEIAQAVARVISARPFGSTEILRASSAGLKPLNTYGGNYGLAALPLHTDLAHWYVPPRYVVLRCIVGSPEVATRIVHHRALARCLPSGVIERALLRPRRRLDGKMYLLRMLQEGIFRWDQLFLESENAEARLVRSLIADEALRFDPADVLLDTPGKTILIDNWNVLHGRSAVPSLAVARRLERVYLEDNPDD